MPKVFFAAGLSAEELQRRTLERLDRAANTQKRQKYCSGRLHWLDPDADSCACGELRTRENLSNNAKVSALDTDA